VQIDLDFTDQSVSVKIDNGEADKQSFTTVGAKKEMESMVHDATRAQRAMGAVVVNLGTSTPAYTVSALDMAIVIGPSCTICEQNANERTSPKRCAKCPPGKVADQGAFPSNGTTACYTEHLGDDWGYYKYSRTGKTNTGTSDDCTEVTADCVKLARYTDSACTAATGSPEYVRVDGKTCHGVDADPATTFGRDNSSTHLHAMGTCHPHKMGSGKPYTFTFFTELTCSNPGGLPSWTKGTANTTVNAAATDTRMARAATFQVDQSDCFETSTGVWTKVSGGCLDEYKPVQNRAEQEREPEFGCRNKLTKRCVCKDTKNGIVMDKTLCTGVENEWTSNCGCDQNGCNDNTNGCNYGCHNKNTGKCDCGVGVTNTTCTHRDGLETAATGNNLWIPNCGCPAPAP
jgi:hypothetical protein